MKTGDEGLVAAYAPCRVSFASRGVPVALDVDTDYPFRETLTITLRPEQKVAFPLLLRVPAWAEGYALDLDPQRPDASLAFEERSIGAQPFSPAGAGMRARARGRRLAAWKLAHGWAGEVSASAHFFPVLLI